MVYEVKVLRAAAKSLKEVPKKDRARILKKLEGLETDPRPTGAIQLVGYPPNHYRIRQGNYRIIYEVRDAVLLVLVLDVDHRKDIY